MNFDELHFFLIVKIAIEIKFANLEGKGKIIIIFFQLLPIANKYNDLSVYRDSHGPKIMPFMNFGEMRCQLRIR